MSYKLVAEWSLESIKEYAVAAMAGMQAVDEVAEASIPLASLVELCDAAIAQRNAARIKSVVASARVRVLDAKNDKLIGTLSGTAFLAAGSKADQEPYNALFGAVTAEDLKEMGPHKVSSAGAALIAKARALNHPQLTPLLPGLDASMESLKAAGAARDDAFVAEGTHEVERRKILSHAQRLVADAEVAVLTRFPGRRDLVKAILAPERAAPRKRDPIVEENGPGI